MAIKQINYNLNTVYMVQISQNKMNNFMSVLMNMCVTCWGMQSHRQTMEKWSLCDSPFRQETWKVQETTKMTEKQRKAIKQS